MMNIINLGIDSKSQFRGVNEKNKLVRAYTPQEATLLGKKFEGLWCVIDGVDKYVSMSKAVKERYSQEGYSYDPAGERIVSLFHKSLVDVFPENTERESSNYVALYFEADTPIANIKSDETVQVYYFVMAKDRKTAFILLKGRTPKDKFRIYLQDQTLVTLTLNSDVSRTVTKVSHDTSETKIKLKITRSLPRNLLITDSEEKVEGMETISSREFLSPRYRWTVPNKHTFEIRNVDPANKDRVINLVNILTGITRRRTTSQPTGDCCDK